MTWFGTKCLVNAVTAEVDLSEGNFTGFATNQTWLTSSVADAKREGYA